MRIGVKGRNYEVSDEIRDKVQKRFEKIGRQVSELATLDVELSEEKNPSIPDCCIAEVNLKVKGTTLRAEARSGNMSTAVSDAADELSRQVKKHRDKRRDRRAGSRAQGQTASP
jgi:putative sigma-54 modulation protein